MNVTSTLMQPNPETSGFPSTLLIRTRTEREWSRCVLGPQHALMSEQYTVTFVISCLSTTTFSRMRIVFAAHGLLMYLIRLDMNELPMSIQLQIGRRTLELQYVLSLLRNAHSSFRFPVVRHCLFQNLLELHPISCLWEKNRSF